MTRSMTDHYFLVVLIIHKADNLSVICVSFKDFLFSCLARQLKCGYHVYIQIHFSSGTATDYIQITCDG
jgi:hypothetical protein